MKKTTIVCCLLMLANIEAWAQNGDIKISGPTCLKQGDTVTYTVKRPLPGYHWLLPSGFTFLAFKGDTAVTSLVSSDFLTTEAVAYGTSAIVKKDDAMLPLHYFIKQPALFSAKTSLGHNNDVVALPKSDSTFEVHVFPPNGQMEKTQYKWECNNPGWTFGLNKTNTLSESGFMTRKVLINTPISGSAVVRLTTIGFCNSVTTLIRLRKAE